MFLKVGIDMFYTGQLIIYRVGKMKNKWIFSKINLI